MTRIELENKHMMAHHELNRCRGNAVAFSLMAEMSQTDEARQSNLGCVAYWDQMVENTKAHIATLEQAIAELDTTQQFKHRSYADVIRAKGYHCVVDGSTIIVQDPVYVSSGTATGRFVDFKAVTLRSVTEVDRFLADRS